MTKPSLFKRYAGFLLAAIISVAGYSLFARSAGYGGFPLDDAWIHQTYARNLAQFGEWSFQPGQPSAGATSFLWVLLLSLGHLLGLSPHMWTTFIGVLTLFGLAAVAYQFSQILLPNKERWPYAIGLLLIFEWHLVWAALSGMETLLFATLCLAAICSMFRRRESFWGVGLLACLAALLRPEGITLLAPLLIIIWIREKDSTNKIRQSAQLLAALVVLFGPYLVFNYQLSGQLWPNTFYAKQAEYAVLIDQPVWQRLAEQLGQPMVGVGLLLLPGFAYLNWQAWQKRNWPLLLASLWLLGFLALFALRLPVSYQHGRYAMPAMPLYFVLGAAGVAIWLRLSATRFWPRVLGRSYLAGSALVLVAFYLLGARAYQQDVAFIETEMVASAQWIDANLPEGTLIAAHDIGALGYFAPHPILDLAGLVSPDVIPFIRDERRLAEYLDNESADYLLTFPNWYPLLVEQKDLIFSTQGQVSPLLGGENMALYRWRGER